MAREPGSTRWTFLTNHGHVLLCLAQSPELRLREVAERVGVTERAVQRIVADLEEGGYLTRHRAGRQNEYEINSSQPMRHAVEAHQTVGALIALIGEGSTHRAASGRTKRAASRPARKTRRPGPSAR